MSDAARRRALVPAAAYASAMAVVAAFAAWPIYGGVTFVAVVAVATAAGAAIGTAAVVRGWRGWLVAVVTVVAFLVIGVTLAVPVAWSAPGIAAALRDVVLGAVTGWKDLVTVQLPVGGYRNLLVPAVVVLLAGTLATLLLAVRRTGAWAPAPALAMTSFGLLFGRTVTSAPLSWGPLVVPAPRETLVGVLALALSTWWLAGRARAHRHDALARAAGADGMRSPRHGGADVRRVSLAAAIVAAAIVVGVVVAPALADGRPREVLRSGVGPAVALQRAVSPLADYRANFSDAAVTQPLFTVQAVSGALPDRIRLATLSFYDGTVYRVSDPDAAGAQFVRVPSALDAGGGSSAAVRIDIRSLRGIWLPTFGALQSVDFSGADAASLADGFYYDRDGRAAVETARGGLATGDAYIVHAVSVATPAFASVSAPGARPSVDVPASIEHWIAQQNAGTGGAALQTLVDRLRDRGYLSHALSVPAAGAAWERALGTGYVFQPSAAGHSLARIDELFQQLLERQAAATAPGASLVAAIGDDEQFAVATALVAEQLGFPARVVVGVRLTGGDDGVPPCRAGVCTGGDVTAWTEVRSSAGDWIPVDVTPQHVVGVDQAAVRERDPENPTDVTPTSAQEVVPPDPVRQDADDRLDHPAGGVDLSALWATLRVTGIVVLVLVVLLGPPVLIAAAKAVRRRTRRAAADAASRVVGGWDEYVDDAVDHGLPAPVAETRAELAVRYGSTAGAVLAEIVDRAVFGDDPLASDESDASWRIVDEERRRLRASSSLWRRVHAAVSLKSFTRGLAPRSARTRGQRRTERRGRARDGGAR